MSEFDNDAMTPSEEPIFLHARHEVPADSEYPTTETLPIVVGAHPRSELSDRPLADRVARHVRAIRRQRDLVQGEGLMPLVLSDIWYLNDADLMLQPGIIIGEPGVNAASAHWASRLPKAFVVEGSHQVLLDLTGPDRVACMWGVEAGATEAATTHFEQSYLEDWLESVDAI